MAEEETNVVSLKQRQLEMNEHVLPEDVLRSALNREDIRSVVLIVELEDGPTCVRYSDMKNADLVWASRILNKVADELIEEDME